MRASEFLYESRGVTARDPGETYINVNDPSDVLTIIDVNVLPKDQPEYESVDELQKALESAIPSNVTVINDNNPNSSTRAAIVATVKDAQGNIQYHVRYIRSVPPTGVHTLWKTIRGYKYSRGYETESLPIKPSDIITDESFRGIDQLSRDIVAGVKKQTNDEQLIQVITEAIKAARSGRTGPIKNAAPYFNVLQKYSGEYLGPIAVISGSFTGGDTKEILNTFGVSSLSGSKVMFPQDIAQKLIDSVIKTPTGIQIQVSSKISQGGGAASSLAGVAEQLSTDIIQRYPAASKIIKILGEKDQINGPLQVAVMLNVITADDLKIIADMDRSSQNIQDLKSNNLIELTKNQAIKLKTPKQKNNYRVFFHVMNAIVNAITLRLNQNDEFTSAIKEALNNNQYVQIITKGKLSSNDVFLDYYTKFPAVFEGKPQLFNKTYASTGIKGRLGFKLK